MSCSAFLGVKFSKPVFSVQKSSTVSLHILDSSVIPSNKSLGHENKTETMSFNVEANVNLIKPYSETRISPTVSFPAP